MRIMLQIFGGAFLAIGVLVTLGDLAKMLDVNRIAASHLPAEGWKMVAAGVVLFGIAELVGQKGRVDTP